MNLEKIAKISKWKILMLFVLLFSLASISNVYAEKVPDFKTADGKDLVVAPIKASDVEVNEGCAGKLLCLDNTEFKLKKSSMAAKVHPLILDLQLIIDASKKCDDDKCKAHYKKMFYEKQSLLATEGIAIHVPKDLKDWDGKKHFWALTEQEGRFFNGEMGQLYSLALEDMEEYLGTANIGTGCKDAKECFKKFKETKSATIKNSYQALVDAEKKAEVAKDKKSELETLKDSNASNDKKVLQDYCKDKKADKTVCDLVAANKFEEAKKKYIPILEKELKVAQEESKEADEKVGETEVAASLPVYTAPAKGSGKNLPPENKLIVAYEGLFTQKYIPEPICTENPKETAGMTKGEIEAAPTEGKIAKIFVDIISSVTSSIADLLFGMDCPGVENGGLSIVTEVLNIASPLNLTQNYIIMKLVSITQSLAYAFAVVLIVFYGIMYTTGYENMEPIKFGVRMFFGMILVYFLPYLMQDILNINNTIVYNLSQIKVTFDGKSQENSFVFAGAIKNWIESMSQSLGANLLTLILLVAMLYLAIQPLVKILIWWYVRMLKIFFYAIIGPIMVIMMALPQTSGMASKWLKDFIGETFSQVFMVLAMAMLAFIVGNMSDFAYLTNLGWLGTLLVMYAAISFLAETPSIASNFLGGIGGLNAGKIAGDVSRMPKKISNKMKQTGASAKNSFGSMASAARGSVANKTGGEGGKTLMESMKASKGIGGKAGAMLGNLAGKAYTAETPKGSMHQQVNAKVKPKLNNIKSNLDKNKSEKQLGYQQNANAISQQAEEKQREKNVFGKRGKGLSPELKEKYLKEAKSLNQQSAEAQLAAESNRNIIGQLKKEGTVGYYKEGGQPIRPGSGSQSNESANVQQYQGSLGGGSDNAKQVTLGQSSGTAGFKRQTNANGKTSFKVPMNTLAGRIGTTTGSGGHRVVSASSARTVENSRKLRKDAQELAANAPKTRADRKTMDTKNSTQQTKTKGQGFEGVHKAKLKDDGFVGSQKINIVGQGESAIPPREFDSGEMLSNISEAKTNETDTQGTTNENRNGNDSLGKAIGEDGNSRNASPEVSGGENSTEKQKVDGNENLFSSVAKPSSDSTGAMIQENQKGATGQNDGASKPLDGLNTRGNAEKTEPSKGNDDSSKFKKDMEPSLNVGGTGPKTSNDLTKKPNGSEGSVSGSSTTLQSNKVTEESMIGSESGSVELNGNGSSSNSIGTASSSIVDEGDLSSLSVDRTNMRSTGTSGNPNASASPSNTKVTDDAVISSSVGGEDSRSSRSISTGNESTPSTNSKTTDDAVISSSDGAEESRDSRSISTGNEPASPSNAKITDDTIVSSTVRTEDTGGGGIGSKNSETDTSAYDDGFGARESRTVETQPTGHVESTNRTMRDDRLSGSGENRNSDTALSSDETAHLSFSGEPKFKTETSPLESSDYISSDSQRERTSENLSRTTDASELTMESNNARNDQTTYVNSESSLGESDGRPTETYSEATVVEETISEGARGTKGTMRVETPRETATSNEIEIPTSTSEKQDNSQENTEYNDDNNVTNENVVQKKVNKGRTMEVDYRKVSEKYKGQEIVTVEQIEKDFNVGPRQARIIQSKLLEERRP